MEKTFIANRLSKKDNILFPDKIIIGDLNVILYKGKIIGYKKIIISRSALSSITLNEYLFFADVIIDSRGGQEIIGSGFLKSDARQIVDLLT